MFKFPFYDSSGNSSQESMTMHTQIKGQETSASPGDPGLGGVGEQDGLALVAQA